MKLSNKIMLSYMLLLIIAFFIAIVITTTTVTARLRSNARTELESQADSIVESLEESRFQLDQPRKVVTYLRNTNVVTLIPADIFLLNDRRNIVFATDETVSRQDLLEVIDGSNRDYVAVYRELKEEDVTMGWLLLAKKVEGIEGYTRTLRRSLALGMMVALLIGAIIALVMRNGIVRPLVSLRKDIARNIEDPEYEIKAITTGDEIEDLYHTYNAMNQAINGHMDERKRFFQNASHELKTPLMSIQGYAEAIRDGVVDGEEEVNQSLDIIIDKSQQLKKTVEEIIYLSKLVNDDFDYNYETVDINALIEAGIEDQQLFAMEKGIRLFLESEEQSYSLKVDRSKFDSVMENLLNNALRYAATVVKVDLRIEADHLLIRVMDDGKGLGNGEESKVFERFYKGEGGNSGIGLAIVSEIVSHHGGSIRAGNHISGGAVFEIKMPYS